MTPIQIGLIVAVSVLLVLLIACFFVRRSPAHIAGTSSWSGILTTLSIICGLTVTVWSGYLLIEPPAPQIIQPKITILRSLPIHYSLPFPESGEKKYLIHSRQRDTLSRTETETMYRYIIEDIETCEPAYLFTTNRWETEVVLILKSELKKGQIVTSCRKLDWSSSRKLLGATRRFVP